MQQIKEIQRALRFWTGPGWDLSGLVLLYGSCRPGRDVDLMVVQDGAYDSQAVTFGRLDMFVIGWEMLRGLLEAFDPFVTEPVLTGKLIVGDETRLKELRAQVLRQVSSPSISEYNTGRSLEELALAEQLLARYGREKTPELLRWVFRGLEFSVSYARFARHYARPRKVTTLAGLPEPRGGFVARFWRERGRLRRSENLICEHLLGLLSEWRQTLERDLKALGGGR